MHERGFSHRNLKPENILFDKQYNLKIADIGWSFVLSGQNENPLSSHKGTQRFMPPEVHVGSKFTGESIDIFESGVILFLMMSGLFPFEKGATSDDE